MPINNVASVFKENDNKLWIGFFGGGLGCFDLSDKSIKIYDSSYGLQDLRVCMIVGDGNKTLWISTLSGLASFDTQTLKMKYYQQGNNFSINEFTLHSGARLKNNSVVFGGNNGIVMLDPAKMKFNKNIPPIVLENMYINDFSVASADNKVSNTQSLDGVSKISLKYNENYVSIQYASLNYISAETNQYKYKLEGFDKDWVDAYDRRTAYYTNLPPGKYRFVVIGSNNDGVWNKNGASLEIVISPPFWKTWYAYLFYTLVLSIALIMLFRWYSKKENRKRQQELLEIELKNREEYHQARNNLFTNFSHELRTPLTLIFTPLQDMIRNSMGIPDPIKKNHKVIYENVTRLIRLVNNLMDFQKKESGAMPLSREQCSISSFSSEMVDSFSQLAQSRQIELVFDKGNSDFISYFDKSLIEKVFFNLLSNAFKNTPDGGRIEIKLTPYTVDQLEIESNKIEQLLQQKEKYPQYIMISVIDSGEGISEDELEKIFTPFYQIAKNEHAVSGTGLGLSLSKSIIEMHNGILWAKNTNEQGAIFNFLLPLFEESESAENIVKEQSIDEGFLDEESNSINQEDFEKKYSVLVVEDNLHLRNFITDTLIGKYKIYSAKNGKEGFNLAIEHLPDLIVSDISMPIMNGMDMVKQLKDNINTSHIPIIVLTAKSMTEDISGAYELGVDDYIIKPFDAHLLKIRIKNILQKREELKQVYKKRFSLDSINTNIVSSDDMFLQKIYETINKNLDNPSYTLDDIAKEIGISRANLYRKIKMITNLSPSEFIRNFRLEMAADILRKTDIPISDVYITVGFNSLSYFSSSFKTLFGLSPSEFIDKHKMSK